MGQNQQKSPSISKHLTLAMDHPHHGKCTQQPDILLYIGFKKCLVANRYEKVCQKGGKGFLRLVLLAFRRFPLPDWDGAWDHQTGFPGIRDRVLKILATQPLFSGFSKNYETVHTSHKARQATRSFSQKSPKQETPGILTITFGIFLPLPASFAGTSSLNGSGDNDGLRFPIAPNPAGSGPDRPFGVDCLCGQFRRPFPGRKTRQGQEIGQRQGRSPSREQSGRASQAGSPPQKSGFGPQHLTPRIPEERAGGSGRFQHRRTDEPLWPFRNHAPSRFPREGTGHSQLRPPRG